MLDFLALLGNKKAQQGFLFFINLLILYII